jgi:3-hydroxyacyl-[acyl-carrier-protein] dehydratase
LRFVLIDRLLELEPGRRAVARKTFDAGEEFLKDHFPGAPLVPGVLLTECMSQTAGWLLIATAGFDRWPLLVVIDGAKFRRPVRPGEELRVEATLVSSQPSDWAVRATVHAGEALCAEARLVFHAFDDAALGAPMEPWARVAFAALGGERLLAER